MKLLGRMLALALSLAWLTVFAACSSGGDETTADGTSTETDVVEDTNQILPDGQEPTDDATAMPDGENGEDVPPETGPCQYNDECNPPTTRCEEGQCVPACPDNPCPDGWVCSPDSGTCYKECLVTDDCTQDGFYCGGTRCEAGCPWRGCSFPDDECDPVSGICLQGFCKTDWEVNVDTPMATLLHDEIDQGAYATFRINIKPQKPTPASINVTITERSDSQVELLDIGYYADADTFVSVKEDLPYDAAPGMQLTVAVAVTPDDISGYYGEVEITTDGLMCSENPLRVIVSGTTSCVSFQPEELHAGPFSWGDVGTETVRLRNDCAYDVTIVKMDTVSRLADWSVAEDYEGTVLTAGGGTADIDLFFWPTIPGNRNTQLLVVTDDHENRILEIPLWGTAVQ